MVLLGHQLTHMARSAGVKEIIHLQNRSQHDSMGVLCFTEALCSPLRKMAHQENISSCFTCTVSTCVIAGRHWEGCVGYAEAVTYHIVSKTTEKKMVQPLLWLCLSYMSMNNKSRALKNKPHCFKKPPGEFLHWYHIFCFFLFFFFFYC